MAAIPLICKPDLVAGRQNVVLIFWISEMFKDSPRTSHNVAFVFGLCFMYFQAIYSGKWRCRSHKKSVFLGMIENAGMRYVFWKVFDGDEKENDKRGVHETVQELQMLSEL